MTSSSGEFCKRYLITMARWLTYFLLCCMHTRGQKRAEENASLAAEGKQPKRDRTRERIRAAALGREWISDDDCDGAKGAAASRVEPDLRSKTHQVALKASRKRAQPPAEVGAGQGAGGQGQGKRRRCPAKAGDAKPPGLAQRVPLGMIVRVAEMAGWRTKLAWSSTCHLAREAVFFNDTLRGSWVDAFGALCASRVERCVPLLTGSGRFALSCRAIESRCRRMFQSNSYTKTDLFRLAMDVHGGWRGFLAARARHHRRLVGQQRAVVMRRIRSRVGSTLRRVKDCEQQFPALASALHARLHVLLHGDRFRKPQELQDRFDGVLTTLSPMEMRAHYIRQCSDSAEKLRAIAAGVDPEAAEERVAALERFEEVRARAKAAASVEDLPGVEEMEAVKRAVDQLRDRAREYVRRVSFSGVAALLKKREAVERGWSPAQRAKFIRRELRRFALPDPEPAPDPPLNNIRNEYIGSDSRFEPLHSSELLVAAWHVGDGIVWAGADQSLPDTHDICESLLHHLAHNLEETFDPQEGPWRPHRDALIRRLIGFGDSIVEHAIEEAESSTSEHTDSGSEGCCCWRCRGFA